MVCLCGNQPLSPSGRSRLPAESWGQDPSGRSRAGHGQQVGAETGDLGLHGLRSAIAQGKTDFLGHDKETMNRVFHIGAHAAVQMLARMYHAMTALTGPPLRGAQMAPAQIDRLLARVRFRMIFSSDNQTPCQAGYPARSLRFGNPQLNVNP